MSGGYLKFVVVLVIAFAGGCDCKNQVRSVFYGSGDTPATPLGDPEDEVRAEVWEEEPNDTPEDATPISLSSETRPVYAAIDPAEDVDWFALNLEGDKAWMVELTVTPKDDELDLAIFLEVPGGPDRTPLMYHVADAGEAEIIPMLSVKPAQPRRFFVTSANGRTGEYTVDVRRRLSAAAVSMAPNDFPDLAMELAVPGEVQGFYDRPHDRDVYYIPAEALQRGIYSLEVSAVPGLTQTLEIFGDERLEAPLLQMSVSERAPAVIPNLSLSAERGQGLYFVLYAGEAFNREHGYRLRLLEHPPADGYLVEREPNDTAETAQSIEVGARLRGYLHSPEDVDRFRFTLGKEEEEAADEPEEDDTVEETDEDEQIVDEETEQVVEDPWEGVPEKDAPSEILQVRLNPLGEAHRLGLRWLGEQDSDSEALELRASSSDEGLVICNQVLERGEFHFEVYSTQTEEGFRPRNFDYEVKIVNIADDPLLEVEPNATPEQADRLPVGSERVGYIATEGDVDVYAFVVGPDEPVVLSGESEVLEAEDDHQEGEEGEQAEEEQAEAVAVQAPSPWEAPETESIQIRLHGNHLNLGFQLLDDEGGRVARVNEAGPGGDEELVIDLPHGLYYVAVSASSGASCEPYRIEVRER